MQIQAWRNFKAIEAIKALHGETIEGEVTGKIYCKECQYEYPCDTIKILGEWNA